MSSSSGDIATAHFLTRGFLLHGESYLLNGATSEANNSTLSTTKSKHQLNMTIETIPIDADGWEI